MGCDIHYEFQGTTSSDNDVVNLEDDFYYIGRNYLLFAVLAGVRNGSGFEPIEPISEPRGSFSIDEVDYGMHSQSWLYISEIVMWFERDIDINFIGYTTPKVYQEWDGKSRPQYCYSKVFGPNTKVREFGEEGDVSEYTDIGIRWTMSAKNALPTYYVMFKCILEQYGDLRLVFEFDN